jgi:hypothetical protein
VGGPTGPPGEFFVKGVLSGLSVAVGIAWFAVVGAGSQSPITPAPPDDDARSPIRPASRSGEYHVITEGCVQGTRLKRLGGVRDLAAEYLNATEWVLEGPREVMQQVRIAYDRHHVEVTGIARLPASLEPREVDVDSRRLPDGTRITVGAGRTTTERSQTRPADRAAPVRLEVRSIRVLAERCG